jgi:aspartate/methionine/tyrosine aminotransferase
MTPIAPRMQAIAPFYVMEVQERAHRLEAQGRSIVHMEIGEPDFSAPPQVVEAAIDAMRTRQLGYTEALGMPELREAISRFYAERHRLRVPPERIAVTTGASGALLLALGVLVGPGDEVLMADPGYPCSRHLVRAFEGRPVPIPVSESSNYQPTAEHIERHWRAATRGLILASPSNPTGTLVASQELRALLSTVAAHEGFTIVDEIYQGLVYEEESRTALAVSDDVIVINSFSKYFNMTDWRLGWAVAPESLMREIEKLAQNAYLSPPTAAQYGALAAFRPDTLALLEERRLEFKRRRDFVVQGLRSVGFGIPVTPQGAFYVYADCARFSPDSSELAMEILERAGVAVTPGKDFGTHCAERYLRFAYTRPMDELSEGIRRLHQLAGNWRQKSC